MSAKPKPAIRVGIGGWVFPPWRGSFFPKGLPQARELAYAAERLTSIEINGTYYRMPSQASFAKWHDETPDGFVFAQKGSRFITNRRVLAEAGPSIERFFASGVMALADKLGPINWQFMPTKRFEPADFEAFLRLLPREVEGRVIRHAVEVRHPSFEAPAFIDMARAHGVAVVRTDHPTFPQIQAVTADFAYLRLQRSAPDNENGYPAAEISALVTQAKRLSQGPPPADVFVYFINGFKPKAPMAAMALIDAL